MTRQRHRVQRRRREVTRRATSLVGLVLIGLSFVGNGYSAQALNQVVAAESLSLNGSGTFSVARQMTDWRNAMFDVGAPVNFIASGTEEARASFLADPTVDFIISGTDFTAAEISAAPGANKQFVKIPIHVTAGGFLIRKANMYSVLQTCPDPYAPDAPPDCLQYPAYTGPLKVPSRNLAAMSLGLPISELGGLGGWGHADILTALGTPTLAWATTPGGPAFVARSDNDASSYYLSAWANVTAPDVVARAALLAPKRAFVPATETALSYPTRRGQVATIAAIAYGDNPASGGGFIGLDPGVFSILPPSALLTAREIFPKAALEFMQVQNANGDWTLPTPDSINKAAAAGGEAPLYAATNKVVGAYPLVWTDYLYVRTNGLTIDKVNALAGMARFVATDGQAGAAALGEGQLPRAMVTTALSGVDRFVAAACVGADRVVQVATTAPFHPVTAGVTALGSVPTCVAPPTPTTTTTTTTTTPTTTTLATSSTTASSTSPTTTSTLAATAAPTVATTRFVAAQANPTVLGAVVESSTTTAIEPAITTTTIAPQPAAVTPNNAAPIPAGAMPLSAPSNGQGGHDRFATMAIGSGLLWVSRRAKSDEAV